MRPRNHYRAELWRGRHPWPARGRMGRHIAYDIGAMGTALALGEALNAPVICSNFSRLVIDPNRGADDPTLIPQLYDGTIIAGNRYLDGA